MDYSNTGHFGPQMGFFKLFWAFLSFSDHHSNIRHPDTNLPFENQNSPIFRGLLYPVFEILKSTPSKTGSFDNHDLSGIRMVRESILRIECILIILFENTRFYCTVGIIWILEPFEYPTFLSSDFKLFCIQMVS